MKTTIVCLVGCLIMTLPPLSYATQQPEDSVELDPVQVTRVPESVPAARMLEATSTDAASDAGEALRSINGVSATRMGGLGLDLSIRGQNQNRLNIVLDGAFVHGGCPNRMDPATSYSPINSYDEITVIKGSQTVLFGSGGSGGTVLLERNAPSFNDEKNWKLRTNSSYSSHNQAWKNGLDFALGGDHFSLRGIYEQSDAENYTDGSGTTVRSAYSSESNNIISYFSPSENQEIKLDYEQTNHRNVLYAGAGMDSPKSDNRTLRASYKWELNGSKISSIKANAYQSNVNHVMDNFSQRENNRMWQMVSSKSDTTGGKVIVNVDQQNGYSSFGLDFQANTRDAERLGGMPGMNPSQSNSFFWPDAKIIQNGFFAELHRTLSAGQLSSGIRLDHIEASIRRGNEILDQAIAGITTANALYANYYQSNSEKSNEDNLNGFVRFSFLPNNKFGQWSLSLSRNMRSADATERYIANNMNMSMAGGMDMSWVGNNKLKPENHSQIELGWSLQKGVWNQNINLYYDHIEDYILRDRARGQAGILINRPSVSIYRNISAKIYGIEVNQDLKINAHWNAKFDANITIAQNTSDNRPIAQISPFEINSSLNYANKQWSFTLSNIIQTRQNRADIVVGSGLDQQKTPGWSVFNSRVNYQLNKHWKFATGINNIFNRTYAYHVNRANQDPFSPEVVLVNEPGRSLWLKLDSHW